MTALEMIKLAMMLMQMGNNARLNWQKYKAVKDKAEAEGRELSEAELQDAIESMDEAVETLKQRVCPHLHTDQNFANGTKMCLNCGLELNN
jgi:hypothetical protein